MAWKKTNVVVLLGLMFFIALPVSTAAQKTVSLNATPKGFRSFFTTFQNAVAKRDKQAVASLTHFPFKWGFDAGDEGTWSKAQFLSKYNRIFDGERTFLIAKNPTFYVEAGTYSLTNEAQASHFSFSKRGPGYQLTAYIVEP